MAARALRCQPGVVPLLALGASDCEALHAGLLGQPVNALSSLAYVVAAAHVLRRRGPVGPAVALVAVGAGSVLYHGPMPAGAEAAHDGTIVALLAGASAVAWHRRAFPRPPAIAVAALVAGVAVNLVSRTGAPLCRPGSLVQGHAAWHVLTAVAAASWLSAWPRRSGPWPPRRAGRGRPAPSGSPPPARPGSRP